MGDDLDIGIKPLEGASRRFYFAETMLALAVSIVSSAFILQDPLPGNMLLLCVFVLLLQYVVFYGSDSAVAAAQPSTGLPLNYSISSLFSYES